MRYWLSGIVFEALWAASIYLLVHQHMAAKINALEHIKTTNTKKPITLLYKYKNKNKTNQQTGVLSLIDAHHASRYAFELGPLFAARMCLIAQSKKNVY